VNENELDFLKNEITDLVFETNRTLDSGVRLEIVAELERVQRNTLKNFENQNLIKNIDWDKKSLIWGVCKYTPRGEYIRRLENLLCNPEFHRIYKVARGKLSTSQEEIEEIKIRMFIINKARKLGILDERYEECNTGELRKHLAEIQKTINTAKVLWIKYDPRIELTQINKELNKRFPKLVLKSKPKLEEPESELEEPESELESEGLELITKILNNRPVYTVKPEKIMQDFASELHVDAKQTEINTTALDRKEEHCKYLEFIKARKFKMEKFEVSPEMIYKGVNYQKKQVDEDIIVVE